MLKCTPAVYGSQSNLHIARRLFYIPWSHSTYFLRYTSSIIIIIIIIITITITITITIIIIIILFRMIS